MKKNFTKLAVALLLACHVMAADDPVMLNFVNSDIEATVKAVGLITGKNFVIDPRVKGTVNVVSSSPVPRSEVYPILLSALRLQGFTVVETPGAVKVVVEADAKQNSSATVTRNKMNVSGDRIVTQIYPLHNESAAQLVPILRPLITPNNSIAAYPNANMLVITDYADNIKRLDDIIASVDQPLDADLQTIPLKHASAQEVATTIGKLMPEVSVPGSGPTTPGPIAEGIRKTVVLADSRANTLLVRGENTNAVAQVRKIAETLDRQSANSGNIHVVYLKNADATKLAATLKAILTGQEVQQSATTPLGGGTPSLAQGAGAGGAAPQGGGLGTTGGTSFTQTAPNGGTGGGTVSPGVAIQADPTTNALIVTAPDNIYNNILSVVEKLDARRAQVYIEAMVARIDVDKLGQFGVQWLVGGSSNSSSVFGLSAMAPNTGNNIGAIAENIAKKAYDQLPAGLSLGVVNGSITGGNAPSLGAIANALESNGDGNVLSTPNILTLDNETATILVGQNLPFISGTQASTGSNPNPFTTVDRKDVGITLKVKPQISEGGSVTLQIYQEVSNVDKTATLLTGNAGLATDKSSIESKVLVDDGQTIVLGGLIQDDVEQTRDKVPLLGDIPLLGNLFRYESREHKRTNLMLFIRPVILRDAQNATTLTNERYRMLQESQRSFQSPNHLLLPNMPTVVLPDVDLRSKQEAAAPIGDTKPVDGQATSVQAPAPAAKQ
ncbi:MAG: type II secretion system secretin GspD [Burkholderiales bacterium]|nr:type II secretion system secretin GspD [Burkholderiales bacterium]